jgi:hypothetical protein
MMLTNGAGMNYEACFVGVDVFEDIDGKQISAVLERAQGLFKNVIFVSIPLMALYSSGRTTGVVIKLSHLTISVLAVYEAYEIGESARRIPNPFRLDDFEISEWMQNPDKRSIVVELMAQLTIDAIRSAPIDVRKDLSKNIVFSICGHCELDRALHTDLNAHLSSKYQLSLPRIYASRSAHQSWIGASIVGSLSTIWKMLVSRPYPKKIADWRLLMRNEGAPIPQLVRFNLTIPDKAFHTSRARSEASKSLRCALPRLYKIFPTYIIFEIFDLLVGLYSIEMPMTSIRITAGEAERRDYVRQRLGKGKGDATTAGEINEASVPDYSGPEYCLMGQDYSAEDKAKWNEKYSFCIQHYVEKMKNACYSA